MAQGRKGPGPIDPIWAHGDPSRLSLHMFCYFCFFVGGRRAAMAILIYGCLRIPGNKTKFNLTGMKKHKNPAGLSAPW